MLESPFVKNELSAMKIILAWIKISVLIQFFIQKMRTLYYRVRKNCHHEKTKSWIVESDSIKVYGHKKNHRELM